VSGEGETVAVSLFDVTLDWIGYYPHFWWHRREAPKRTGMRHPLFVPYGPHFASDGRLVNIAVLSPEHWRAFCADVLGRADLAADERYATMEGRVAHRGELEPRIEAVFRTRPAAEWLELLEQAGIPCGAVNELPDVMAHPQLEHNRMVTEVGSPVGPIPTIGSPIALDGERPDLGPVPGLGEHTREVLEELGLDDREIAALV
jgi:crotonobetainyl-CoA:carnitine CoA-transferase CaiB-like acyl-CoA transferase